MKYRSSTEIVAMILEAANGRATKTKIMYKAYLLSSIKNNFVFIKDNLIEYIDRTHKFKTTDKRLFFLKIQNEIGELLPSGME
jgi:predicted transcriptional regulator